jgi:spermidine/putrescine transport system permease protein
MIVNSVTIMVIATTAARGHCCPDLVVSMIKMLIVAAVFCFILSFGDFVSPYYLGGSKPPTLSILIIDTTKSGQQWPRAAVVAITMIVTLFAIMFTAIALAYRRRS